MFVINSSCSDSLRRSLDPGVGRNRGVVTWGGASFGGDSTAVVDALTGNVLAIYATAGAFTALKGDGSVITWGDVELSNGDFCLRQILTSLEADPGR